MSEPIEPMEKNVQLVSPEPQPGANQVIGWLASKQPDYLDCSLAFSSNLLVKHRSGILFNLLLVKEKWTLADGTKEGWRKRTRRLTVLDGAAMVSISSWVTQTLPDGYEEEGAGPERQSSSGVVVQVR